MTRMQSDYNLQTARKNGKIAGRLPRFGRLQHCSDDIENAFNRKEKEKSEKVKRYVG